MIESQEKLSKNSFLATFILISVIFIFFLLVLSDTPYFWWLIVIGIFLGGLVSSIRQFHQRSKNTPENVVEKITRRKRLFSWLGSIIIPMIIPAALYLLVDRYFGESGLNILKGILVLAASFFNGYVSVLLLGAYRQKVVSPTKD